MIDYNIVKELVLSGCKYQYDSYDYDKARQEIREIIASGKIVDPDLDNQYFGETYSKDWVIPDKIKQKHQVWRIGKIRLIKFNNNSEMWYFKIGCRYYKTYYIHDFGVKVKPIISKFDDRWGLIPQGLAIEKP